MGRLFRKIFGQRIVISRRPGRGEMPEGHEQEGTKRTAFQSADGPYAEREVVERFEVEVELEPCSDSRHTALVQVSKCVFTRDNETNIELGGRHVYSMMKVRYKD